MNTFWKLKPIPNVELITTLQKELSISPLLSTLLVQRGITTYKDAENFFRPKENLLHSPFLMKNMEEAVECFIKTMNNKEKILIYGDYDVDGTTSVSLFINVIKNKYKNFDYYIPDRMSEGYGLNEDAIHSFAKEGVKLIITLDCGVQSVREIKLAKEFGMNIIVCDHHEPGEVIPNGIILDPKQKDDNYPFDELCGCGVTFKFLQAVFEKMNWNKEVLFRNTDIVALAIGADIVPIIDENRVLCSLGIAHINKRQDTVIDLMFQEAKKSYPVILSDIVFTIAPRINAAGRMRHAKLIVELFTSTNLTEIKTKIFEIDQLNTERRQVEKKVTEEAVEMVQSNKEHQYSNVVYQEDWFKGVVGIVASKLVEENHRPSIVLTKSNGQLSGSGRSIPQINLFDVLEKCKTHLLQYGGHAFACGLTLNEEQLPAFKTAFEKELKTIYQTKDCSPILDIDLEIDFDNIINEKEYSSGKLSKFIRILQEMEPFGPSNMRPVFLTKDVYVSDFKILKDMHIKFEFQQKGIPIRLNGIGFFMREKFDQLNESKPVDIVFSIGVNYWNGTSRIQLEVKDIRNSEKHK